jgi:protein-L-isoaspartate(D-aspartate) O-methyltransferase
MASFLNLRKTDTILDIGCGVGWSTAVISKLCKTVFAMERFKKLLDIAKKNIAKLKIENVQFKLGTDSKDGEIKLYLMQLLLVRLRKSYR